MHFQDPSLFFEQLRELMDSGTLLNCEISEKLFFTKKEIIPSQNEVKIEN